MAHALDHARTDPTLSVSLKCLELVAGPNQMTHSTYPLFSGLVKCHTQKEGEPNPPTLIGSACEQVCVCVCVCVCENKIKRCEVL